MTSKELTRRLQSYRSLDIAARYFASDNIDYVFRITYVHTDGSKDVIYASSYNLLVDDYLDYAMVERFSFSQFKVQLGYFRSFFARCSKTQQDYVKTSSCVDNLLDIQV